MQEFKTAAELRAHYAALKARNKWMQEPSQDGRLIPLKPVPAQFRYRKDPHRKMAAILRSPVVWQSGGTLGQLVQEIEEKYDLPAGSLIKKNTKRKIIKARQEFCFRALRMCKTCSIVARFLQREHSTILSQADQYRKEHERELAADAGVENLPVSEGAGGIRMGSVQQPQKRPGWGEIEGFRDDKGSL